MEKRESFWIIKFKINRELTIYLTFCGWDGIEKLLIMVGKTNKNYKVFFNSLNLCKIKQYPQKHADE